MTKIITGYGKLYKYLKRLNCLLKILNPTKPVAIDEVIVLFKGKVIFKQHVLRKHKKFIIKIYEICDTSGCTYDSSLYLRKQRKCK
jgi:hypothetical protein